MSTTERLHTRYRRYRAATFWLLVAGLYLLGFGVIHVMPPASGTAFHAVAIPFAIQGYVEEIGLRATGARSSAGGFDVEKVEAVVNFIRLALFIVLAVQGFRRKMVWIVPTLLALQLSFEVVPAIERRSPAGAAPQDFSPAVIQTMEGDAAAANADYALQQRFCGDPPVKDAWHTSLPPWNCDVRGSQMLIHYLLAQRAYITNRPADTYRHLRAVEAFRDGMPSFSSHVDSDKLGHGYEATLTWTFEWRAMVMHEWLQTRGYKPGDATANESGLPLALERNLSRSTLTIGAILTVVAAALALLSIVMRLRIRRIATLMEQFSVSKATRGILRGQMFGQ